MPEERDHRDDDATGLLDELDEQLRRALTAMQQEEIDNHAVVSSDSRRCLYLARAEALRQARLKTEKIIARAMARAAIAEIARDEEA
jgi:broad specificity phosphatase PhoE